MVVTVGEMCSLVRTTILFFYMYEPEYSTYLTSEEVILFSLGDNQ